MHGVEVIGIGPLLYILDDRSLCSLHGTSLNTAMATGQAISVSFAVTQGSTAYYNSAVQVDGTTSGVTTKWQGSAPTSGNASSIDVYNYVIIKTGSAAFTVLASQTKFS